MSTNSLAVSAEPTTSSLFSSIASSSQRALINLLRIGPIPKHVGFIMDGNRRYAKKLGVQTRVGHVVGSKSLEKTLEWCLDLGINVVTVYAFSIENFKRPREEVDVLMDLACRKFEEFSKHSTFVSKHSIRIRVLGDKSLLPPHVLEAARQAEAATRHHTRAVLNICCPYTSRHEMAESVALAVRGVKEGHLKVDDIDEHLLDRLMQTGEDPELDILMRTSGEKRLSDFLLWQVTKHCQVHFLDVLWPEFSFWNMLPVLLSYQANYTRRQAARIASIAPSPARITWPGSSSPDDQDDAIEDEGARGARVERYLQLLREEKLAQ
ncbi:hypothetical protein SpCBS45565_g03307 [Spizellomyces sp. 'palustris']|nr:hypothetical protein SpCBS45565_g03307 [Spizellomyces sp. 'palustris']